jgi:hypothetical protein
MPAKFKESPSSRSLATLLDHPLWCERLRETGIHKTMLWRYATGRGKPRAVQAGLIHKATKGRVSALGWQTDRVVQGAA